MISPYSLILAGFLASSVSAGTIATDKNNQVQFCNQPNMVGKCDTVWFDLDNCFYIPDASAGTSHISLIVCVAIFVVLTLKQNRTIYDLITD